MDFSTMYGLMNPQGGDPFSLGAILQNPDKAAEILGGAGVPPPTGTGMGGLIDAFKNFSTPQSPNPLSSGFVGTPAVDPTQLPTVPYSQSNLGLSLGGLSDMGAGLSEGGSPTGGGDATRGPDTASLIARSGPPTISPAFGGTPGAPGQERTGTPFERTGELSSNPNMGVTSGPTLEQAGLAPGSPLPPEKIKEGIKTAQNVLQGLKAPATPEAYIPKAGTPSLPHQTAMPKDQVGALLAALMAGGGAAGGGAPRLRLAQALGGLRG